MNTRTWMALLAMVLAPTAATSQEVSQRIAAIGSGAVRFTYPARPGVEICDDGIRMGDHRIRWRSDDSDREPERCREGPVEVEVKLREGEVRDIDVVLKAGDRTPDATDLGAVSPEDATDYFLGLARGNGSHRGAEDALFPAVLADVHEIWRELLDLAQDRGAVEDVRTSALFWVGQEAAAAVTEELAGMALSEDEDQDIRDAAVFALSQRPDHESVPVLMDVARTAPHPDTRRSAMFWLAQSEDERVYAFFEEILVRKGGV
jgi:hypothetical protein